MARDQNAQERVETILYSYFLGNTGAAAEDVYNREIRPLEAKLGMTLWNPESHWDEHPQHPSSKWRQEVEEDNTRQSYVQWVNSQIAASQTTF
jgi:hypothetical protein